LRFKLYISTLSVLLVFSAYMYFHTAGFFNTVSEEVRLESIIPYDEMSSGSLASRFSEILGDNIVERTNVIRLQGCVIEYFKTGKNNSVQIGFCRGEFRFLSYTNIAKIPLKGLGPDVPSSVGPLLKELSGDPYFTTDFILQVSDDGEFSRIYRGHQAYGNQRILASGYLVEWDLKDHVANSITFFDVYRLPVFQSPLPKPSTEKVMSMIYEYGFSGFTYREPYLQGLKICGGRPVYSLRIVAKQSPLHGYEALIDVYTGEVYLLIGLSALGVYRVWEKPC
jgi:hypothetical protein